MFNHPHTSDESMPLSHRHTAYLGYLWAKIMASNSLGERIRYGPECTDRKCALTVSLHKYLTLYFDLS